MNEDLNIPKEYLGKMRRAEECIDIDTYGIAIAAVTGLRSKDPSTQVGACIMNKEGNVISTGFNAPPKGWAYEEFPFDKPEKKEFSKYTHIIHAEENAIKNFNGDKKELEDSKMYVTFLPCPKCAAIIMNYGIKNVIYLADNKRDLSDAKATRIAFHHGGVKLTQYIENKDEELDSLDINLNSNDEKDYAKINRNVKTLKYTPKKY